MKWKDVVGFEGFYRVNEAGEIVSLHGSARRKLRPSVGKNGYMVINLSNKINIKMHYVHDIVCAAFLGEKPEKFCVNHRDAVKTNNHIENLEYVTYSDNLIHAYKMGLNPRNKNSLTARTVKEVKKLIQDGWSQRTIAEALGVSDSVISNIKNNKGSYASVGL